MTRIRRALARACDKISDLAVIVTLGAIALRDILDPPSTLDEDLASVELVIKAITDALDPPAPTTPVEPVYTPTKDDEQAAEFCCRIGRPIAVVDIDGMRYGRPVPGPKGDPS